MTVALNSSTLPAGFRVGASAPARAGIVHLGLGQFHRAHAAVYTALAMAAEPGDWGIVGVANRSHTIVDAMRAQDYLYSILELTPGEERVQVADVHRGAFVAADQADDVLAALISPTTRVITLTLTEAGYHTSATGRLDLTAPDIAADLAHPYSPTSLLGILATGLWRRCQSGGAPVTVLSCDNMLAAGHTAHDRLVDYLSAAQAPGEVLDWLSSDVKFPNAMVDRIVPSTTDATRAAVERILGVRDAAPVPAEKFTMWVMEDVFAAGRPAWEKAGVIFTDEVDKYELIKLRLLNGCYSLLSTLGVLAGKATNPEAITTDYIAACVHAAQDDEYLPTLELPAGFDVRAYIDELFERWANTALGDATYRVATDGSVKLAQRIVIPANHALEQGLMPQQMALTAAAWICVACPPPGFDPGELAAKVVEPKAAAMARATAGASSARDHTLRIMHGDFLPHDLTRWEVFNERVADFVEIISRDSVRAAAGEALASRGYPNADAQNCTGSA